MMQGGPARDPLAIIREGVAIPAHPLALDAARQLDPRRQRALTRYYVDAGAGGLAVGVHTTQFAIREAGLYEAVLSLAAETAADWTDRPLAMIAGVAGRTRQAVAERASPGSAHAVLFSLAVQGGGRGRADRRLRRGRCRAALVGFYLQPVGGLELDTGFWKRFAGLDNVVAIKVAPFHRYRTLDVIRGVAAAGAEERITLYTGNDDHILLDLLTPFTVMRDGEPVTLRFKGGLLGHWSVWTRTAVALFHRCREAARQEAVPAELLALDSRMTDCNSAFFDVANNFHGCIAGCHEVLRRQGLLEGTWCLDPVEGLSPGQAEEIDRVYAAHGDLADDAFVRESRDRWLAG
ncbi:MAG: dihydrodipicolinate synthase family protein [Geminicoccaceae bacterium]